MQLIDQEGKHVITALDSLLNALGMPELLIAIPADGTKFDLVANSAKESYNFV